jgi:hypothetical protein
VTSTINILDTHFLTSWCSKIDVRDRSKQLPALQVVLGWQVLQLRKALLHVVVAVASIWIIVVLFGVTIADWSLSVGIGQLVAACFAILYVVL